jgi:hypothetical protein
MYSGSKTQVPTSNVCGHRNGKSSQDAEITRSSFLQNKTYLMILQDLLQNRNSLTETYKMRQLLSVVQ